MAAAAEPRDRGPARKLPLGERERRRRAPSVIKVGWAPALLRPPPPLGQQWPRLAPSARANVPPPERGARCCPQTPVGIRPLRRFARLQAALCRATARLGARLGSSGRRGRQAQAQSAPPASAA